MTSGGSDPQVPPAEVKDWTWVLNEPCRECGFDASSVPGDAIAGMVRLTAQRWRQVLADPDVGRRPKPTVWSALEYACHCRDVYRVFGERVELMRQHDDARFENWDQDATALQSRYWTAAPATVAGEITRAAADTADQFDAVADGQWSRTGRRRNGSSFTILTLGEYLLHDLVHHLHDVGHPIEF